LAQNVLMLLHGGLNVCPPYLRPAEGK